MAKKPKKPKTKTYKIQNCRGRKGCMATSFEEMKTNIKVAA